MFRRLKGDRRQGYSLVGHWRRVASSKGAGRVAASLGATAIVAAIAFAHCSSSSITGPNTNQGTTQGTNGNTGHTNDLFPPAKSGPIRFPMTMLPDQSPCTGQPIAWDPTQSFTMMQATTQSGTDGQLHSQYHMNTQAQGVTNQPTAVYRSYVGSEEYDSQDFVFTTQTEKHKVEWNVKVIAKGEDGGVHDEDDFFIHIVMNVPLDPTQADLTASGYCR